MFGAGYVGGLGTTGNPLFVQNIDDVCAACLQRHENGRTSNMCDVLPVEDTIEIYKLLESISLFKYSEGVPQLLCSTCLFKLVNIYEFQQMCNTSFSYINNYITQRALKETCKLEIGDIELYDLCTDSEAANAEANETNNEREKFIGETYDNDFREELVENSQERNIISVIAESLKLFDLESTSTKILETTTEFVNTDSIEKGISTNESIGDSSSLDRPLELTGTQSFHPESCTKKDPELDRQIQNIPSTGTNKVKFVCKYCNKVFKYRQVFKNHIDMHEDVRNCVCAFCGQQFRTLGALTIHERGHTGENPYKCDNCEKAFKSKSLLIIHTNRHHRPDQSFCCEVCGKKLKCRGGLRTHMAIHAKERPYKCTICGKGYNQTGALRNHMYNHGNDDGKDKPVSGEEKMFKCTQCEKAFARRKYLARHRREVHTEERRYACKLCDCKYKDALTLKRHMIKHSGLRPYVCTYCNKDFNLSYTLKVHLRTHEK